MGLDGLPKRSDLLFDLARAVEWLCGEGVGEPGGVRSVRSEQAPRVWRFRDRLSEADMRSLVSRYQEGVIARELAEHFKIGMTSVKCGPRAWVLPFVSASSSRTCAVTAGFCKIPMTQKVEIVDSMPQ